MDTKVVRPFYLVTHIMLVIAMIMCLVLFPSCAPALSDVDSSGELGDVTGFDTGPLPVYFDFDDISVPSELTLDRQESFVYETPGVKAGILVLKGRVDVSSLVSFFTESMPRHNWTFANSFKYKSYILNFYKKDKSCLISIYDKLFTTVVEIRVGPLHGVVEKPKE